MSSFQSSPPTRENPGQRYDAVVIGAGFAGMYALYRLRNLGLRVRVYERGSGVGGTWYWNRYPGARCDTESMIYSYSFSHELEQEWEWTERYAPQPEILAYAEHVAERFDLKRDIEFNTTVSSLAYDDVRELWHLTTDRGERATAQFCITATGCMTSAPAMPDYPGLSDFRGAWYHTGRWPHEAVDFRGKRVAVIGTGSSGIQAITAIAKECKQLVVFQRTPNYSVPAWNGPLASDDQRAIKADYLRLREDARYAQIGIPFVSNGKSAKEEPADRREREYERAWAVGGFNFVMAYPDLLTDIASNRTAADFVARKIREKVADPKQADLLTPNDHPLGTKRMLVDTGYYETFNRDNVTLVDLRSTPIEAVTATGIRTTHAFYEADILVFATGFDAITGPLFRLNISGRSGLPLEKKWAEGPRTYLGLSTVDFPNLFMITGPGSPCVLSNMLVSIEQHVDWIADCIQFMRARGMHTIEPSLAAENDWVKIVHDVGHSTLYPMANSWYTGANIEGKVRMFTPYAGGVGTYRRICDEVVAQGYRGFDFFPRQMRPVASSRQQMEAE
jgi:cyclohexanone monooxygenase